MAFFSSFVFLFMLISCTSQNEKDNTELQINESSQNEENMKDNKFTYLALGDSYTIGESVDAEKRFPVQLALKLNENGIAISEPEIIAQTGWTTNELAAAIESRNLNENFDLVTLLIGVNNQYRGRDSGEYLTQFAELLQTAVDFAGDENGVIVISIPDYGVTPFGQERNPEKIAEEIDLFNRINMEETQKTDAHYVDITGISRKAKDDASLVASDGLHPSGKMYRLWVEEIFPVAKQILENKN
ncbi:MAG: SGNH/GDSL hydrolase family protein [Bacteroidota bacterium]